MFKYIAIVNVASLESVGLNSIRVLDFGSYSLYWEWRYSPKFSTLNIEDDEISGLWIVAENRFLSPDRHMNILEIWPPFYHDLPLSIVTAESVFPSPRNATSHSYSRSQPNLTSSMTFEVRGSLLHKENNRKIVNDLMIFEFESQNLTRDLDKLRYVTTIRSLNS